MVTLVHATRAASGLGHPEYLRYIAYGASPRASIYLYRCAKIHALFAGRSFTIRRMSKRSLTTCCATGWWLPTRRRRRISPATT